MKILLIDHDDSFTHNLSHWLKPLGQVEIVNHLDLKQNFSYPDYGLVVLSPGPKTPSDYLHTKNLVEFLLKEKNKKIFGVCLGLQILCSIHDCEISTYSPPLHGKKSKLKVSAKKLIEFNNLSVARYHSLFCKNLNTELLEVMATSQDDNIPMWVQSKSQPWYGVQFHPESFLTEEAHLHLNFLKNWIQQ